MVHRTDSYMKAKLFQMAGDEVGLKIEVKSSQSQ